MSGRRILVVDDETTLGVLIREVLEERGCDVAVATSAAEGLALLDESPFDVALLDVALPRMSGLGLLGEIKKRCPDTEVVMMTSHTSADTVLRAIRQGAYDYLEKPFDDVEQVWRCVERVLEKVELRRANRDLLAEQRRRSEELSAAVMRLTSFIEAGQAMSRILSLPELLDLFLGLVTKELGVGRASLMLLDEKTGELTVAAHRGMEGVPIPEVRVRLGEGVAGKVAQTGEHLLVEDVARTELPGGEANPRLSGSFMSAPIMLSIPIKSSEKVLGVINVTNRASGRPFDREDLAYLAGMAGQLAVAIDRGAKFQSLQEAYDSLRRAQEQLVFSERLNVVGRMAAGVAHEFNNALSVILGRTESALASLPPDRSPDMEKIRQDLAAVVRTSLHGAAAIRRIQDYTRIRRDVPHEIVELNRVICDSVEMTRPKWKCESAPRGGEIDLTLELGEIPTVEGNPHELNQVVSNLIFNAVEAMPEGGRVALRTKREGRDVVLEVVDTGSGMDEETRARVFEPFFTTKENGNGLGMSIVYGIVTRHRGIIAVESAPGEGTTFRVRLPACRAERGAPRRRETSLAPPRSGRILLVEDEPDVRATFVDALTDAGHEVVGAASGTQALEVLGRRSFDLVLTDLNMPGCSGREVIEGVRRLDPALPVGVLSGWVGEQEGEEETGADFVLPKPCRIRDLLDAVQRYLRRTAEA